jgi:hypothetical protein
MLPRIDSVAASVSDRNFLLTIRGAFTSDPPYVLLEDLVVPRDAIQVSSSQIVVNLSSVQAIDLSVRQDFLVTVGQSGWSDTAIARLTPPEPGSYNQAGDTQSQ